MNISHDLSTSREDERIAREAADWLTRHIGCERAWDADGFEAWIEADPRHLETYERLARAWDDMGALGHLRPLGEPNRPFPNIVSEFAGVAAGLMRARAFSAAVTALTALGLAALFLPPLTPSAARYTTAIAEIEPVLLADGSVVTLGARSGLDVDFSGRQRAVTLREGQAFFEVARNEAMPFTVHAGKVSVHVLGTRFDVRRGLEETVVSVQEGLVEVRLDGIVRSLRTGDRLTIAHPAALFGSAQAAPVVEVQPAHVAAWREGRLSYDDAPLREVAADLNRYYAPGVEIADADAGAMRITASFRADEVEGFLRDLSSAFPVRAVKRPDGRYRLSTTQ